MNLQPEAIFPYLCANRCVERNAFLKPPMPSFLRTYAGRLRRVPFEAFVWTAGLVALAWTDPATPGLIEGCVFQWLGITWCPGCGLGHAVAHLFRGEVAQSLAAHPLGAVAVMVLAAHIGRLVWNAWALPHPVSLSNNTYPQ